MEITPDKRKRGEFVEKLFTRIATRYDIANDLQSFYLHRLWKRRVADLARINDNSIVLDICCGTGDIAFELAQRGPQVIGIDFSQKMIEMAHKRCVNLKNACNITRQCCFIKDRITVKSKCLNQIVFIRADSLKLPFNDNSFDAVTIGYGLRNLSDWKLGLAEMVRVARPGGRIVILEFGKPDSKFWRGVYFWYLKNIVPWLGKITAGDFDAYYYIYESLIKYPGQHLVMEEMQKIGCKNVRIINFLGGAMTINYGEK